MDQQTAIEELKKLSIEVDSVSELSALKPVYFRLDQISKQFPNDFDVQVVASELKQRLVAHGQKLKDAALGATGMAPVTAPPPQMTPPPPTLPATPPVPPSQGLSSGQSAAFPPQQQSSPLTTGAQAASQSRPTAAVATPLPMQSAVGKIPSGVRPTSYQTQAGQLPPKPPAAPNFKRALMIGAGIGLAAFAVIFVFIVQLARNRNIEDKGGKGGGGATVSVEVSTVPEGAQIQIGNEERQEKCKSNCKVELPPGNYRVTALLDGYDPTATSVTVAAGPPIPVSLSLTAQAQTLRILSDVGGKVLMDGKPAGDIQEGQFIIDRVPLGAHTIAVNGPTGDASFAFTSEAGKAPKITTPATARNLLAVLVAGSGNQARLHTSSGPLKMQLDGQAKGDVNPAGVDVKDLSAGEHELLVGEGKDAKKIILSFAQTPMLTAYLKSDVNLGFLVVVAGQEDDVAVSIEGRTNPRKTVRGQLRVQLAPGKYKIKAVKDGFGDSGEQIAEIKKGEESKIAFTLKALPRVATLKVTGATPGATVSLDHTSIGKVGPDGSFSGAISQTGDRILEFSLANYTPKEYRRSFKAGETVSITDAVLAQAISTLRLTISPPLPESKITLRKEGEQPRNITEASVTGLQPGNYTLTARAQGYVERVVPVAMQSGETRAVDLTLKKEVVVVQPPVVKVGGIGDLEGSFTRDGDAYIQKGPASVMYKSAQTNGVFTFSIKPIRGKKLRWMLNFKDNSNYVLIEVEKNKFTRHDVINGRDKKSDSVKLEPQDIFRVTIDIRNGALLHTFGVGGLVDNWTDAARNFGDGKFGFRVEGKDEIAITDFKFTPSTK